MIILSIDSGIEKNGYAIFNQKNYIDSGLITTSKSLPTEVRLKEIFEAFSKIIKKYHPQEIIIEQLFFFKNQKTAIKVSQSQGVIMYLAAKNNIKIRFMTPLQVKQTLTGYGGADKKAIQKMLKIELGLSIKQDDQADAIALGYASSLVSSNFT